MSSRLHDDTHWVWSALLLLLSLVSAALVGSAQALPSTDLPQHVASIAGLLDSTNYEWVWGQTQNLGYPIAGALLAKIFGDVERANRVLLMLACLAWPWGVRALARSLGRDSRVGLLVVPLFWGQALNIGLLPFLVGTTLTPWLLAGAIEQSRAPTWMRAAGLAVGCAYLFTLHLSVLVFLLPAVVIVSASQLRSPRRLQRFGWLSAPMLLVAHWLLTSTVLRPHAAGYEVSWSTSFHTPLQVLRWLPEGLLDIWVGKGDDVVLVLLGLVTLALIWFTRRERNLVVLALASFGALLCFAMPYSMGWLFVLNQRYAMLAAAMGLLLIGREASQRVAAAFGAATVVAFAHLAITQHELSSFGAEYAVVDEVVNAIPSNARVLSLASEADSKSSIARFLPFHHAMAWARVRKGAIVEPSFVMLPQSALRYRSDVAPPAHPHDWEWDADAYPTDADTAYFDTIVIRRAGASRVLAAPWREVLRAGAYTVYRR